MYMCHTFSFFPISFNSFAPAWLPRTSTVASTKLCIFFICFTWSVLFKNGNLAFHPPDNAFIWSEKWLNVHDSAFDMSYICFAYGSDGGESDDDPVNFEKIPPLLLESVEEGDDDKFRRHWMMIGFVVVVDLDELLRRMDLPVWLEQLIDFCNTLEIILRASVMNWSVIKCNNRIALQCLLVGLYFGLEYFEQQPQTKTTHRQKKFCKLPLTCTSTLFPPTRYYPCWCICRYCLSGSFDIFPGDPGGSHLFRSGLTWLAYVGWFRMNQIALTTAYIFLRVKNVPHVGLVHLNLNTSLF